MNFSAENLQARRQWNDRITMLKEKKKKGIVNQEFYIWQNCSLKMRAKLRHSQIKTEGIHSTRTSLQEILKRAPQVERKGS